MIRIAQPLLGEEEEQAVLAVLRSGRLAQGPLVRRFEEAFARYIGVREAVAVSSGTAALQVALLAHGIGPGDEVITTPFTFAATANAILATGARPVFADVSEEDFNLDPAGAGERIGARTRALLPVHLYGQPADMEAFAALARRRGLVLIEDACQAAGASFGGRKVGSFGTGCFSFYATKNMTTGEGGMITTDDRELAARARLLRNHGQRRRYVSEALGYNLRLTEVAAALGLAQLQKLDALNERRRANARYLRERLSGVTTPRDIPGRYHVYHQYTVRVGRGRDALLRYLRDRDIEAMVFYPVPVHKQPLYRGLGYRPSTGSRRRRVAWATGGGERLPVAERLSREVLSLPVHPGLSREDLEAVVQAVRDGLAAGQAGGVVVRGAGG
jgi:dTDP-4-amino-4,6-dideoxygalactose transaminase